MNVAYHSARLEGKIARTLYYAALPLIVRYPARIVRELPLDVFAYSGENTLPEQVASIRSFLAHAGRPKQFTVVSDRSEEHTSELQSLTNLVCRLLLEKIKPPKTTVKSLYIARTPIIAEPGRQLCLEKYRMLVSFLTIGALYIAVLNTSRCRELKHPTS